MLDYYLRRVKAIAYTFLEDFGRVGVGLVIADVEEEFGLKLELELEWRCAARCPGVVNPACTDNKHNSRHHQAREGREKSYVEYFEAPSLWPARVVVWHQLLPYIPTDFCVVSG
jgi:hypothetical protein